MSDWPTRMHTQMISPETGMTPLQHYLTLSIIDLLNNYEHSSRLARATSNSPISSV